MYLNKKELSGWLGISTRQINRLMLKGLPYKKISYRKIIFDSGEVKEWIDGNKKNDKQRRIR